MVLRFLILYITCLFLGIGRYVCVWCIHTHIIFNKPQPLNCFNSDSNIKTFITAKLSLNTFFKNNVWCIFLLFSSISRPLTFMGSQTKRVLLTPLMHPARPFRVSSHDRSSRRGVMASSLNELLSKVLWTAAPLWPVHRKSADSHRAVAVGTKPLQRQKWQCLGLRESEGTHY